MKVPRAWCVVLSTLLGVSTPVNKSSEVYARLTLLALQASVRYSDGPSKITWILDNQALSSEEVVHALNALRKPVVCEATREGSIIFLQLRDMTEETELAHWRDFQTTGFEGMSRVIANQYGHTGTSVLIDVRWSNESIVLPMQNLKRWFLEYRIHSLLRAIEDPDDRAKSAGAVAIMRLGSVKDTVLSIETR